MGLDVSGISESAPFRSDAKPDRAAATTDGIVLCRCGWQTRRSAPDEIPYRIAPSETGVLLRCFRSQKRILVDSFGVCSIREAQQ